MFFVHTYLLENQHSVKKTIGPNFTVVTNKIHSLFSRKNTLIDSLCIFFSLFALYSSQVTLPYLGIPEIDLCIVPEWNVESISGII